MIGYRNLPHRNRLPLRVDHRDECYALTARNALCNHLIHTADLFAEPPNIDRIQVIDRVNLTTDVRQLFGTVEIRRGKGGTTAEDIWWEMMTILQEASRGKIGTAHITDLGRLVA